MPVQLPAASLDCMISFVMSCSCLQEWFHFVDKEKQVRVRLDGKVNQMVSEAAELKAWTISEVSCASVTVSSHVPTACLYS